MESPCCDLCGANDTELIFSGAGWRQPVPYGLALVRCRRCQLIYLNPRPDLREIGSFYTEDYAPFRPAIEDESSGLMRWMRRGKMLQRRRLVEKYSGQFGGHILDVGCGTGLFLNEMQGAGWTAVGVEPTESAAKYARSRFNLDVFHGMVEQAPYASGSFDAVTFWDVLEHTHSPTQALRQAAQLLRPGGLVAINVPNWRSIDRWLFGPFWIGYDPPRHLYVFSRQTLTGVLRKAGFRPIAWKAFMPSYFPFVISLQRSLASTAPRLEAMVSRVVNFPGVRFPFEPWFGLTNWLGVSSLISVFAERADNNT